MVSVRGTDTICTVQKITHLLYRLERTDTKNQFSKIKNTISLPPQIRVQDLVEGGGVHAHIRWREEAAAPRFDGGRRWQWCSRSSRGRRSQRRSRAGGERRWRRRSRSGGGGGHRSSSWSPRWGRRASVGITRGHGRRALLVVVVAVRHSWSWSSSSSSGPKLRTTDRLILAKSSDATTVPLSR
jgi:hypothetical protein